MSPAQAIIKWLLQQNIAVIPRSSDPLRLLENFNALRLPAQVSGPRTLTTPSLTQRPAGGARHGRAIRDQAPRKQPDQRVLGSVRVRVRLATLL